MCLANVKFVYYLCRGTREGSMQNQIAAMHKFKANRAAGKAGKAREQRGALEFENYVTVRAYEMFCALSHSTL